MIPDKAFILAAGFGTRMRPLTETMPKPMVEVAGRSLLERTLDHLERARIQDVVINTHYLAEKINEHVKKRAEPNIILSHEPDILDTAGGIKHTLDRFNAEPFFVLSGDGLWKDHPQAPALKTMTNLWDPEKMDILILLQPTKSMKLTRGVGDYHLEPDGRALRAIDQSGAYMFTSMRINHPRIFDDTPDTPFSYLQLLDKAQEQGRLYGAVHQGDWHHISTPADLEAVNQAYREKEAG